MAYGSHDGRSSRMIHLLKYEAMLPAADSLAGLLVPVLQSLTEKCDGQALLIPVPLFKSKQRQREFNQSELLARTAMKKWRKRSVPSSNLPIPF